MYGEWAFFNTPQVLTDDIFTTYGGSSGTSTAAQRAVAYTIAEQQAMYFLGTYLVPTTVTGTFSVPASSRTIELPTVRARSVSSVIAIHDSGCNCASEAIELSACAWVMNEDAGILDISNCSTATSSGGSCNCADAQGGAKQYRIVYTAGFSVGTLAANPPALMGLVTAADLALQQMIDPAGAEGGAGDAGVQSFSDSGYSESRTRLKETPFGSSARANYAANMLKSLRIKRPLAMGRYR